VRPMAEQNTQEQDFTGKDHERLICLSCSLHKCMPINILHFLFYVPQAYDYGLIMTFGCWPILASDICLCSFIYSFVIM
jgi:hypothetical protein